MTTNRPSPFPAVLWSTLLATAGVLAGGCGNVIDLEVDAHSICVASASQTFPGTPTGEPSNKPVPLNFSAPLREFPGVTGDLEVDVRFKNITLTSAAGDLGFVERVVVELHPSDARPGLAPIPLADYQAGTTTAPAKSPDRNGQVPLVLQANDSQNIYDYVKGEPARLNFQVFASLPAESFTLDVEGCIGATARFRY